MAEKIILLEVFKSNQEYAVPFVCEVSPGDILKFQAKEKEFKVTIDNADKFFSELESEKDITRTIPANSDITWGMVNPSNTTKVREKYYTVYCPTEGKYADRLNSSPPKMTI